MVYDTQPACPTCPASFEKYTEWKQRNQVFQAIGGSFNPLVVVTGLGDPERVQAVRATASLLDVFQIRPEAGRWLTEADDQQNGPKVVVLSDGYWRRRFNADPNAIGSKLTIDDDSYEVIGILPAEFQHRRAELYLPVQRAYTPANRGSHFLVTYARLKPGVTQIRAQREMVALGATARGRVRSQPRHRRAVVLRRHRRQRRRATAPVDGRGVVRPAHRLRERREPASRLGTGAPARVRRAHGAWRHARGSGAPARRSRASRSRSWVVLVGLAAANWIVRGFVRLADTILPRASTISIDWTVTAFAFAIALLTGLFCGLWPVFRLNSRSVANDVRQGDLRTGTQGRPTRRLARRRRNRAGVQPAGRRGPARQESDWPRGEGHRVFDRAPRGLRSRPRADRATRIPTVRKSSIESSCRGSWRFPA